MSKSLVADESRAIFPCYSYVAPRTTREKSRHIRADQHMKASRLKLNTNEAERRNNIVRGYAPTEKTKESSLGRSECRLLKLL